MSGHSKWSTIKRKKGVRDQKRGKVFTKLVREITIAARMGGGDSSANPRLRLAIQNARGNSMPRENIERAVKKGTGDLEGSNYQELTYEGYGPAGVAILVQALTDNTNRTASEVRSSFSKRGGSLGAPGSVAWMFEEKGLITVPEGRVTFDALFEAAVEAGADDVREADEGYEIITDRTELYAVSSALEDAAIDITEAKLAQFPGTMLDLEDVETARKVLNLIDVLEDLDDVLAVWANLDISDEIADLLGEE